jgi:aspartyl/asparaginyl-tRNA synthetase
MMNLKNRLQLQMSLLNASHRHFLDEGYGSTISPKIVPFKDDEPDHLISVDIHGKDEELFLSRSPQLYKEIACLNSSQGKIYEIGPVFRGEPVGNGRRANEFVGVDVEIKTENLSDILGSLEKFIFSLRNNSQLRDYLNSENLPANFPDEIVTITYDGALKDLNVKKIDADEEKDLSRLVNKNSSRKRWVFLTEFPAMSKGFYQIKGDVTDSFDLVSNWEICSGGLRRQDVDEYFDLLNKIGWSTKEMETYAKIKRKNKHINTGGYGVGLERLAGTIIGEETIGNVQPYKRIPEEEIKF